MDFEWDENKRRINAEKHKIDFADVIDIFDDIVYTLRDEKHDYGEHRFISIGLMRGVEIVAVYTVRKGVRRILSARRANSKERMKYNEERRRIEDQPSSPHGNV
jgi:uncharacterized DUF497 family protein